VENLLESYYAQVDGLYDKLVAVGEYAKDTEEYINIELDSSRNRLIRLEILLTAATFAIAPMNILAGACVQGRGGGGGAAGRPGRWCSRRGGSGLVSWGLGALILGALRGLL
jgi:hypothetical protein